MNRLNKFTFLFFILTLSWNSMAQDVIKASAEKAVEAGFSELERQLIKKYLGESKEPESASMSKDGKGGKGSKGMPPGLAKRDSLPPGLASQLQRNGTLPPGLAKRDLPADLANQLPPARKGYERSILEDMTVILIEKATGRIADIIKDEVIN